MVAGRKDESGLVVLRVILLILGIAGCFFWYSDYEKFNDPRDRLIEAARSSMGQVAKVSHDLVAASSSDQSLDTDNAAARMPSAADIAKTQKAAVSLRDAQQLIERGEPLAAIAILEEMLRNNPDDTQAMMELAMIHILDLKDMEKARQILEKIVRLEAGNRAALNELVNIYSDPLRLDQGLAYLKSQMEFAIDPSELHYAYGRLLAQAGRTDEALTHFDQSKGLKDIQDQVALDAAQAAVQAGNFEKALENYGNAIRLQEEELSRSREQGVDSGAFIEERIFSTKMDWARTLLRAGRIAQARSLIDGVYGHEEDPNMISIRNEISTLGVPM